MKKILFSSLMILAITLTACSSLSIATVSSKSTSLPIETQIAVGTLKLAGTDQDITVDQAKNLVVYWQVYKELSQSQTAAQAEVDGLVVQIQETMTAEQISAISEMNISQQDVFASMQGVTLSSNSSSSTAISVPSGSSSGGGMPAGGPPADGGGAPPDGGISPDIGGAASGTSQTTSARTSSNVSVTANVPSALVEAVIQSLQKKIAA